MSDPISCADSDGSFGPAIAANCRGGFDFTLTFEQAILIVAPCAIFLAVLLPFRLTRLRHVALTTPADWLCRAKLVSSTWSSLLSKLYWAHLTRQVTAMSLAAVQLASLVLWAKDHDARRPPTGVSAAVLALVAALAVCVLSYAEHTRSRQPSIMLGIFLSLAVLFDVAVVRTLWLLQPTKTPLAAIATIGLSLKVVLLVLEALPKQSPEINVYKRPICKEAVSGPYSIAFFWWLNTLFVRGFRATLTLDDLSTLENEFASDTLSQRMQAAWEEQTKKTALPSKHTPISAPKSPSVRPLLVALVSALAYPLLIPVPARLVFMAFNYAQPFLIMQATNYVQQPESDGDSNNRVNNGYGLIGAAALIYLGIAVS